MGGGKRGVARGWQCQHHVSAAGGKGCGVAVVEREEERCRGPHLDARFGAEMEWRRRRGGGGGGKE